MKELLKRRFELWVKMRWLKTIDKEVRKRQKLSLKYHKQEYVVEQLVKEYNKLYADEKIIEKEAFAKPVKVKRDCSNCKNINAECCKDCITSYNAIAPSHWEPKKSEDTE